MSIKPYYGHTFNLATSLKLLAKLICIYSSLTFKVDQSTKRIFEAEKLQSEQKELFGPRGSQANRSKDFF